MFDWLKKKPPRAPLRYSFGLPHGYRPPSDEVLTASLREIVRTNMLLDAELTPKGLMISPIWQNEGGSAAVHALMGPRSMRERYFTGDGEGAVHDSGVASAASSIFPWMSAEPDNGAIALEDTYLFWSDPSAPVRKLDRPWEDHLLLMSLIFADLVRKASAGAEWIKTFMASGR